MTSIFVYIVNMRAKLLFLLLLRAIALHADDVSGRWSGTLKLNGPNEAGEAQPFYLILNQNDAILSGSAGKDERSQSAIGNGRVTPDGIQFDLGAVSLRLRLNGGELEGTGSRGGQPGTATIHVKRVGELAIEDRIPRLVYEGPDRSPRILELRDSIQNRGPSAAEEFWSNIREHGGPLIEPIKGNDQSYLVTFLWRGSEQTRSVLLLRGRFSQFQPENNLLSHIDATDVWFKTLKLRRGSRFQYTFSENDPRSVLPLGKGTRRPMPDPLNSRHVLEGPGAPEDQHTSLLELPGALAQPWYKKRTGVPALTLTKHRLKSEILNNERDILVYTPPGYAKTASPYPTLYLFDGEDADGLVFASQTVENLIHDQKLPPIVIVRIANPGEAVRDRELGCLPEFTDFLARELVPFVRRNYNVSSESGKTAIGGYSRGGLAAAFAGLKHSRESGTGAFR